MSVGNLVYIQKMIEGKEYRLAEDSRIFEASCDAFGNLTWTEIQFEYPDRLGVLVHSKTYQGILKCFLKDLITR